MAVTLALKEQKENAHSNVINSVAYSPDGTKIISGSYDATIKVWDAGALPHPPSRRRLLRVPRSPTPPSPPPSPRTCPPAALAGSLEPVEEHSGDYVAFDASASGAVAERDGATLRLREGGGAFYAPYPLTCVAVSWPRLVAGTGSGELYHLEVEEGLEC